MPAPSHIALMLADLQVGGAQRVATILANEWVKTGVRVTILTLDKDKTPAFALDPAVNVMPLALSGKSPNPLHAALANLVRISRTRKALRSVNADVVIGFGEIESLYAYLAVGKCKPVICYLQTNPRHRTLNSIWRRLSQSLTPRMAGIVVQTERGRQLLKTVMAGCDATVIANPVPTPPPLPRAPADTIRLMAAGRLDPAKGFDILIKACALLPPLLPAWSLTIWGDGPERKSLVEAVAAHKLIGKVDLPGFTSDMQQAFAAADAFILSSRREGFPNVLVEAMAAGLAVVAADCETGPADIIDNGTTGLLVTPENPAALSKAMQSVIEDADMRRKLAANAPAAIAAFTPARIAGQWLDYLARLPASR